MVLYTGATFGPAVPDHRMLTRLQNVEAGRRAPETWQLGPDRRWPVGLRRAPSFDRMGAWLQDYDQGLFRP